MTTQDSTTLLIGNFDGIHLGHQSLINFAKEIATNSNTELRLVTFCPHPREVILKKPIDLILPYNEKVEILKNHFIDKVVEIKFTEEISKMSPENFIETYLEKNKPSNIVVGKNFRFGSKASGNVETLKIFKDSKFNVHAIDIEESEGKKISSTLIKDSLRNGKIQEANHLLGRNYYIKGVVIQGEKRGREIGFPTTNLETNWSFLPKVGVYVTNIFVEGVKYSGITNIGFRPTFGKKDLLIESHLFDFNEFIYGANIKIEFIQRIRSEKKFDSVDELIENIKKDVQFAKKVFAKEKII